MLREGFLCVPVGSRAWPGSDPQLWILGTPGSGVQLVISQQLKSLFLNWLGRQASFTTQTINFKLPNPIRPDGERPFKLSVKLGEGSPSPTGCGAVASSLSGSRDGGCGLTQATCPDPGLVLPWVRGAGPRPSGHTGEPVTSRQGTLCPCKCTLCLSQGLILIWVIFPLIITSNYSIH